jgi:hypothetical protein
MQECHLEVFAVLSISLPYTLNVLVPFLSKVEILLHLVMVLISKTFVHLLSPRYLWMQGKLKKSTDSELLGGKL